MNDKIEYYQDGVAFYNNANGEHLYTMPVADRRGRPTMAEIALSVSKFVGNYCLPRKLNPVRCDD